MRQNQRCEDLTSISSKRHRIECIIVSPYNPDNAAHQPIRTHNNPHYKEAIEWKSPITDARTRKNTPIPLTSSILESSDPESGATAVTAKKGLAFSFQSAIQ